MEGNSFITGTEGDGEGDWEPFIIADSLDNFQLIISILNKISNNRATRLI